MVGNGGAGPYFGIKPLDAWHETFDVPEHVLTDYLARPCPLRPDMERGEDWLSRLGCSEQECFQGTIAICDQGCTACALLVVSGEARGRVVYANLEFTPPYFVPATDFLAWYEHWLDELLKPARLGKVAPYWWSLEA